MMLARVADSLYWIGRYIERAEHFCRLADVMLSAAVDRTDSAWQSASIALSALGEDRFDPAAAVERPADTVRALVFDRDDTASVFTSLARARENARQVRDQITTETWERLNLLYLRVTAPNAQAAYEQAPAAFLHEIIADLHLFKGASDATMSHGEGWRFLLTGVYLERAQLIARLMDVCFGDAAGGYLLNDHFAQLSVLRMACAMEPYLRVYTAELQPRLLMQFLLFDEEFPRSIRFCAAQVQAHLTRLSRANDAFDGAPSPERLAGRLSARLEFADFDEVAQVGASAYLATIVQECARIHEAVYEAFVAYPLEMRLPA
ncbi:MAG: alpha-E domain-containing protein [Caulobacteraceae bacterium]